MESKSSANQSQQPRQPQKPLQPKFAVIFKAEIKHLDSEYDNLVKDLRQLAFEKYHCLDFVAYTQGNDEVAISYWQSLEDIQAWKADTSHLYAQKSGQQRWYRHYQVEVVELLRIYSMSSAD